MRAAVFVLDFVEQGDVRIGRGDQLTQRTKPVPAFGFDCRAIKALFRQAYLVGQRVSGDVGRRILDAFGGATAGSGDLVARMVEAMETAGVVSAMNGNGSREVIAPGPMRD